MGTCWVSNTVLDTRSTAEDTITPGSRSQEVQASWRKQRVTEGPCQLCRTGAQSEEQTGERSSGSKSQKMGIWPDQEGSRLSWGCNNGTEIWVNRWRDGESIWRSRNSRIEDSVLRGNIVYKKEGPSTEGQGEKGTSQAEGTDYRSSWSGFKTFFSLNFGGIESHWTVLSSKIGNIIRSESNKSILHAVWRTQEAKDHNGC